ncbi:MAG: hypothetical protein PVF68_05855 [Acidobacteriota bacterium]|jgi:hypothetical protein
MRPLVLPRTRYYAIGIVLLVVAAFVGLRFYQRRLEAFAPGLVQVVVPGSTEVEFPRPGHGTVFLEPRSVVDGSLFLTPEDPGRLEITLRGPDGSPVPLLRAWMPVRYELDQRAGVALFDFRIRAPGRYRLEAAYPPGTAGGSMVLAVGYGVLGDLSGSILRSLAVIGALALAGLVALVTVERLRARSRRGIYGRFRR